MKREYRRWVECPKCREKTPSTGQNRDGDVYFFKHCDHEFSRHISFIKLFQKYPDYVTWMRTNKTKPDDLKQENAKV